MFATMMFYLNVVVTLRRLFCFCFDLMVLCFLFNFCIETSLCATLSAVCRKGSHGHASTTIKIQSLTQTWTKTRLYKMGRKNCENGREIGNLEMNYV